MPNAPQTPPRQNRAVVVPAAPARLRVNIPALQMNMGNWRNNNNNVVMAGPPGGAPNEPIVAGPRVRRERLQFNMNVNMGASPPGGEPAEGGRRKRKSRKVSRKASRKTSHKSRARRN
jgi:hypothetical protein